jgi:hypothetical protein
MRSEQEYLWEAAHARLVADTVRSADCRKHMLQGAAQYEALAAQAAAVEQTHRLFQLLIPTIGSIAGPRPG